MVLQSDMYPAVGYKHQHNYSHEEEDYYSQNSYNYSSMQMMRPKPNPNPNPNANYMISSPQPPQCHVAMAPGGGYSGHYDHHNKDKYYGGKDKFYEEFSVKERYQEGYGGGHYDHHNKDKYYENKEKFNEGFKGEKQNQDGYGHYDNKERFTEGFKIKEKYQDGYGTGGHYDHHNKDRYHENKEKFSEGFKAEKHQDGYGHYDNKERCNEGFKFMEKFQDGYGNYQRHDKDGYGHNKFSMDKMMSGGVGGYGTQTHFVTPHMGRPMPYDHREKTMDNWEFKDRNMWCHWIWGDSIFWEERIEEINIKRARRFPPADHNRDKYHVESEYEDGHVQRNKDKYDGNKEKYQDGYGDYYNRNKDKYNENKKLYGGLNVKLNCQNGYDHHGNFNEDKYKENKKFYEGFNVKEKYEDYEYSDYENRNEDQYEKLGVKVNPKGRKAFQDFDGVGHSSNIHYSDDYDEVQSNKSTWSVVANKEK
nr:uncharacterized protein LOC109159986 [Ipomoea batatas]